MKEILLFLCFLCVQAHVLEIAGLVINFTSKTAYFIGIVIGIFVIYKTVKYIVYPILRFIMNIISNLFGGICLGLYHCLWLVFIPMNLSWKISFYIIKLIAQILGVYNPNEENHQLPQEQQFYNYQPVPPPVQPFPNNLNFNGEQEIGPTTAGQCCAHNVNEPEQPFPREQPVLSDIERAKNISENLSTSCDQVTKYVLCPNNHYLQPYTVSVTGIPCRICGSLKTAYSNFSWCRECLFFLCERCIQPEVIPNISYPACKKLHPLVFSRLGMQNLYTYQCVVCKTQNLNCAEGRYFCGYCNISVCPNCQSK